MHNSVVMTAQHSAAPIAVSRVTSLAHAFLARMATAYAVYRERQELRDLDARMLADIGLTRHDVERESARNLWDIR